MPVDGFRTITVRSNYYNTLYNYYHVNKELLYQHGITNMTGLVTFLVKRGVDTLPDNFTALSFKSKNEDEKK